MIDVVPLDAPAGPATSVDAPWPASGRRTRATLVVVGAGGNIGSHLVPHLGRLDGVERVVLIDPDAYEPGNRKSQSIDHRHVGRAKVTVQAQRLRRIRPDLRVHALRARVQQVPLGVLQADVVLAGVDNRETRRVLSELTCWLRVPYIDAGVEPTGLLARINVFVPRPGAPCLQCGWHDQEYATLERSYPCLDPQPLAATSAPSSLGALAAALQASECEKLLSGRTAQSLADRELVIDTAFHRLLVSRLPRNPRCRFDHACLEIERVDRPPSQLTVADAFTLAPGGRDTSPDPGRPDAAGSERTLAALGVPFVRRLTCPGCGRTRRVLCLASRLSHRQRWCRACRREMVAAGIDVMPRLDEGALAPGLRARPLSDLGFATGDVVTLTAGARPRHVQLGDPWANEPAPASMEGENGRTHG